MNPFSLAVRARRARQFLSGVLLVHFLLAGLPLPLPELITLNNERFPCEKCACGCSTARHCWTACCCHTPAQRMAWAKRNGVTPPPYAIVDDEPNADQVVDKAGRSGNDLPSCCSKKEPAKADALPNCCQKKESVKELIVSRYVVLIEALKCRGVRPGLGSLGWVIMQPPMAIGAPSSPLLFVIVHHDDIARTVSSPPVAPPPERCLA